MFARAVRTGMLFLAASACMWAQGEAVSARLTGTVLDDVEAVVPGARLTLSDPQAGFARQWLTGADGHYIFASIPPGRYQLRVEKQGFKTYLNLNIVMAVGQSSDLDPKLEVGAISQVIDRARTSAANRLLSRPEKRFKHPLRSYDVDRYAKLVTLQRKAHRRLQP